MAGSVRDDDSGDWILKAKWIEADIQVEAAPDATVDSQCNGTRPAVLVPHLVVPDRGITAIIGESGSGKSSLLAMLSGLKPALAYVGKEHPGEVPSTLLFRAAAGRPPVDLLKGEAPAPGDIGFVFQEAHLLKSVSAMRNAALGAVIAPAAPPSRVFEAWAGRLELHKKGAEPLETYSGGQQQRVAVMRALGMDPALLVCDEPTSSLDDRTADTVMREIFAWALQPGRAVLWVTHNRDLAARYAHRVVGVRDGQVHVRLDGRPVEQSPAGDDDAGRLLNLNQIADLVPPRAPSAGLPAAATEGAGGNPRVASRPHRRSRAMTWLQATWFAFTSSMAIAFADNRRAREGRASRLGRSWPVALLDAGWRLALRSLTLVLLLGLTVFCSVYTASTAFDRHFERKLASPEIAHFMLTARLKELLAVPRLPVLDKALVLPVDGTPRHLSLGLGPPPPPMREPRHYGRRTNNMSPVWRADGTRCAQPQAGTFGPGMLVFNAKEPLFADLEITLRDGAARQRIGALSTKGMAGGVIVTPAVFSSLGITDPGDEAKLEGFCVAFDFGAPSYVRIVGTARSLPGGGDRQYGLAVEEATYRRIFESAKPQSYRDENGRLQLPVYQEATAYFDYRDRDRVFCGYLGCKPGEEDPVKACQAQGPDGPPAGPNQRPELGGYRIDCNSLAQISSLINTANSAKWMFLALALVFLLAMALSTALAAAAMVAENAKPIAVMRAFGYNVLHVFILLFGQLVVMLLVAFGLFYGLVAVFDAHYATRLALSLGVPLTDISIRPEALLVSAGGVALSVVVVAFVVLLVWWVRHRHIGPVLQAL
jgi:ABC-type lipoprotein export system ATPase subunit